MGEDAFRRQREDYFQRFATHLVAFMAALQPPATPAVAAPPAPARNRRTVLLAGAALLAAAGGAVAFGLRPASPPSPAASGGVTPPPPPVPPTGPDGRLLMFRFDALGGGSPYIRVFPGVQDTPSDLIANGRYNHGDVVPALCRTIGRLEKSDPSVGERPREPDVWVRIAGSPGEVQYARLTYGEMAQQDLDALPEC
jgi:hypothetical protein